MTEEQTVETVCASIIGEIRHCTNNIANSNTAFGWATKKSTLIRQYDIVCGMLRALAAFHFIDTERAILREALEAAYTKAKTRV